MKCPHCGLTNPSTAQRCDCGYDFDKKALMEQGVPPLQTEPIRMADRRWLWAARCSALIFFLITLIAAFRGYGSFRPIDWLLMAAWWLLSLGQLWLLFRRGKNPLALGLGMGAALASFPIVTGAITVPTSLIVTRYYGSQLQVVALPFLVVCWLLIYFSQQPWLFWPGCISLLTLGVSAVVVFTKMRDEGNRGQRPRLAFGAGIFCTLVVCFALSIFLWINFQPPLP